ncbi:hypothetical protein AB0A77_27075 [Streptomyces varsoviensis]|uniref:hypothetical protein n=1 Tax=Streptomyces varsoviensis TaxID=67373 RepID=UPI0033CFF62B
MTDPMTSKYDTTPLPEGDGDDKPSPDHDKHLDGLVPTDKVAWGTPPSFNNDPQDIPSDKGSEAPDKNYTPSGDFKIDPSTLRTAETSMLTEAKGGVAKYEEVRKKVMAEKGYVFGQGAQTKVTEGEMHTSLASGYNPKAGTHYERNPFADSAEKFGADMNPAMERALLQVGSTLEKLGEYIALLNHAGQVYGHTDRESRFPDPPAK